MYTLCVQLYMRAIVLVQLYLRDIILQLYSCSRVGVWSKSCIDRIIRQTIQVGAGTLVTAEAEKLIVNPYGNGSARRPCAVAFGRCWLVQVAGNVAQAYSSVESTLATVLLCTR